MENNKSNLDLNMPSLLSILSYCIFSNILDPNLLKLQKNLALFKKIWKL